MVRLLKHRAKGGQKGLKVVERGPKIFLDSSGNRFFMCHFDISYAPTAQRIWSGSPNIGPMGAKKELIGDRNF